MFEKPLVWHVVQSVRKVNKKAFGKFDFLPEAFTIRQKAFQEGFFWYYELTKILDQYIWDKPLRIC